MKLRSANGRTIYEHLTIYVKKRYNYYETNQNMGGERGLEIPLSPLLGFHKM